MSKVKIILLDELSDISRIAATINNVLSSLTADGRHEITSVKTTEIRKSWFKKILQYEISYFEKTIEQVELSVMQQNAMNNQQAIIIVDGRNCSQAYFKTEVAAVETALSVAKIEILAYTKSLATDRYLAVVFDKTNIATYNDEYNKIVKGRIEPSISSLMS